MKRFVLTMVLALVLSIAVPALAIPLNSNESATFKFDFGVITPMNSIIYNFSVKDIDDIGIGWYGSLAVYDELGEAAIFTNTLTYPGAMYSSTFSLIAFFPVLSDDPVSYMTVTFFQGEHSENLADFSIFARTVVNSDTIDVNGEVVSQQVAEPATMLLFGAGLAGLFAGRRMFKR